jgi:four helix bundle protein
MKMAAQGSSSDCPSDIRSCAVSSSSPLLYSGGLFLAKAYFNIQKGANMKTFRTLELAIIFHEKVEAVNVTGHLRDQLMRAAASIALNLSEGNAKPSEKEKKRFYQTAYASVQECKTVFKLLKSEDVEIIDLADKLGAYTYNLLKSDLKVNQFKH